MVERKIWEEEREVMKLVRKVVHIKAHTLEEARKEAEQKYGILVALSSGKLVKKAKKKGAMNVYSFKLKKGAHKYEGKVVYAKAKKGTVVSHRDALLPALPPGKRISKNGKVYYEYRPNRSDWPSTRKYSKTSKKKKRKKK